jgi:hypothetical protein
MEEIIKGYCVQCECCGSPLIAQRDSDKDGHYHVFIEKEDAQKMARSLGMTEVNVIEVQMKV